MALYGADKTTKLTRTTLGNRTTAWVDPDPLVTLNENIYEEAQYAGATTTSLRLLYWAGDRVRTSELDRRYGTPTVTAVSPAGGPAAGGTEVTITGTGFVRGHEPIGTVTERGSATVTFGGTAATSVVVVSDTEITCVAPAHAAGAVAVAVQTDAGSGSLAGSFTYA